MTSIWKVERYLGWDGCRELRALACRQPAGEDDGTGGLAEEGLHAGIQLVQAQIAPQSCQARKPLPDQGIHLGLQLLLFLFGELQLVLQLLLDLIFLPGHLPGEVHVGPAEFVQDPIYESLIPLHRDQQQQGLVVLNTHLHGYVGQLPQGLFQGLEKGAANRTGLDAQVRVLGAGFHQLAQVSEHLKLPLDIFQPEDLLLAGALTVPDLLHGSSQGVEDPVGLLQIDGLQILHLEVLSGRWLLLNHGQKTLDATTNFGDSGLGDLGGYRLYVGADIPVHLGNAHEVQEPQTQQLLGYRVGVVIEHNRHYLLHRFGKYHISGYTKVRIRSSGHS
jgi:hypothetical protein